MILKRMDIYVALGYLADKSFFINGMIRSFHTIYYRLPRRSGFFCPGNLRFSNRFIKLFLLRDFETRLDLGLPWILGV